MNRKLLIVLLFLTKLSIDGVAQSVFYLSPLPEPIANNAVVGDPETGIIYSFSGIDSSLTFNGIHAKSFLYDPSTEEWTQIADLPSGTPRIAASATILNDTIYVIGGYQVNSNGSEVSLDDVHTLSLKERMFSEDAPAIPLPIDDHVQENIGDTALIQFTGWSNTGNTTLVQHYIPGSKEWRESSRTRNQFLESFGSAGVLLGDTLYYIGGAADATNFPIQPYLRKGAINPSDLTDIKWSFMETHIAATYRPGAFRYENKAYWIGGGENTYNFDGIAYDGSGVVSALSQLLEYDPQTGILRKINIEIPEVMDLRGIAQISETEFCVVGGMGSNQNVLNDVWCIDLSTVVHNNEVYNSTSKIVYPNPVNNTLIINPIYSGTVQILNDQGQKISEIQITNSSIDVSHLISGVYYLNLVNSNRDYIKFVKVTP